MRIDMQMVASMCIRMTMRMRPRTMPTVRTSTGMMMAPCTMVTALPAPMRRE